MSESSHRPKTVADNLGISPATMRLWSNKFHPLLSPIAQKATTEAGTSAQRRYTDTDVLIFTRAKQLLDEGKPYEETLSAITDEGTPDSTIVAEQAVAGMAGRFHHKPPKPMTSMSSHCGIIVPA